MRHQLIGLVVALVVTVTACGDSADRPLSASDTTAVSSVATTAARPATTATTTSTTTAAAPTTTVGSTSRTMQATVTSTDGWKYTVALTDKAVIKFSKDISTSPPGKAKLRVVATAPPTGSAVGLDTGRTPPAVTLAVQYLYTLNDAKFSTTANQPDMTQATVRCNISGESMLCDFGWFGGIGAGIMPPPQASGDAGVFDEALLDELLAQLSAQQPTLSVQVVGVGGQCIVYFKPDGSHEAKQGQRCKVE
jgi:hypothetical protein